MIRNRCLLQRSLARGKQATLSNPAGTMICQERIRKRGGGISHTDDFEPSVRFLWGGDLDPS